MAILMMTNITYAEMSQRTYNIYIDQYYGSYRVIEQSGSDFSYNDHTLYINIGDTVIWINDANPEEPLTIINDQGLWNEIDAYLRWNYQKFQYTFDRSGTYTFYIKEYPRLRHLKISAEPIQAITPTPAPIPIYNPNNPIHNTHVGIGTINIECSACHGFPPKIYEIPRDCATCHPIPIPTFTPTEVPSISATTELPTSTVTTIVQSTDVETIKEKRAILAVTYKVDRSGDRAVITINVKNIGDDKARFVKFNSEIPPGIDWRLESGADIDENMIKWDGDLDIGQEHNIIYSMNRPNIDINIPLEVTYVKDSATANKIMAKAAAKGIRSEKILDDIDPQDLEKILLIIQISKALLPGFEIIFGISGILSIYYLRKRR